MIQNKRDLGGIRTMTGETLRPGMLIRSAHLAQADEQDLEGISAIIDLRTPGERNQAPDQPCGRQYLPLPIFDEVAAGISHEQETEKSILPDMAMLYGKMMRECAASYRRVLLTVMEHDYSSGAVLWHCTEGKDRCGMTTALILEILGVDRQVILEDYLKTNLVNLPKAARIRDQLLPTHGEAFADSVYHAFLAEERYLCAAWEAMGEDYLHRELSLSEEQMEQFRKRVLLSR